MSSSFFGLTIGLKGLNVSQQALEIISHNISNINTPGHSKQEAVIKTTDPQYLPTLNRSINTGQVGTGVEIEQIRRLRDQYADMQLRNELPNLGKWQCSIDILQQTEIIFSEPGDSGLSTVLNDYWNSWKDLEVSPEDSVRRQSLIDKTKSLTTFLNSIYSRLTQLRSDINTEIKNNIDEINNYASQIKQLNETIKNASIVGDVANDLMDRRDVLIDKLSQIVNVNVKESKFGQIDLFVGSKALVMGGECYPMEANLNPATKYYDILWADDGTEVNMQNGEIFALKNFRDNYIPSVIDKMNNFVSTLISSTNTIHSSGFGLDGVSTGNDFFTGSDMTDIAVNPALDDINLIAAASNSGQSGDNSNIHNILTLRESLLLEGNTLNFDSYYNGMIIQLGVDGQQISRELENTELLIDKINLRKDSVSGVSLDEEMVNMVKFQHAYNAAAKIISTMDELFDTIINQL